MSLGRKIFVKPYLKPRFWNKQFLELVGFLVFVVLKACELNERNKHNEH
jgi:hypothetical protein